MKIRYFITGLLFLLATTAFGQSKHFGLTYSFSVPLGGIDNYISAGSFRGANLEGYIDLTENFSAGWLIGMNTFFEKRVNETYEKDNLTLNGTQYRYMNVFPMLARGIYQFGEEYGNRPYIGAGLGMTRDIARTDIGLYSFSKTAWHFTMAPEIGINIPLSESAITASVRYVYGVKARDLDHISYLSFNLGFLMGGF